MRIALVQVPVWWTLDPPLGLAQIAGCAGHHGHEVFVFDLNILLWHNRLKKYENLWSWEQSHFWNLPHFVDQFFKDHTKFIDACVEQILRTDAPVIGFSVYYGSHLAILEIARRIKKGDPRRKIVLGGQYFFFGDKIKEMLCSPSVDAVVQGAGDKAFPELLKCFDQTGELEPLPGVWIKRGKDFFSGGRPEPVHDLDGIPFADFTLFPMELYTDPVRIPMQASRGCVWQCRFCSSRAFWKGYCRMSGDRIFAEVMHHRKLFPDHGHVEFYDITANGDVQSIRRFARLTAETFKDSRNHFGWKINAIISPEMTPDVLKDLMRANCHDIIYGIESGSARVLKAMKKNYSIKTAERVLKDTHESGIITVANFMVGYPGETEDNFQETLEFLRRNSNSLDRVYSSATFTSLEAHSYLTEHQEEFGIRKVAPETFHNLYWETKDGKNSYPVRLQRYKRFRELAISLGIDAYKGVAGALEQDHLSNLAQYNHHAGKPLSAIENYLNYLELDLYHEPTRQHLARQIKHMRHLALAQKALSRANNSPEGVPDAGLIWEKRTSVFLTRMQDETTRIEREDGRFILYWSRERVPEFSVLSGLLRRVELFLALAESEIGRGEAQTTGSELCAR